MPRTRRPMRTSRSRSWAPTTPAKLTSPRRWRSGTMTPASPPKSCGWSRRSSRAATSDLNLALQELGADYAGEAYVTATVAVWDNDPRIAAEKLRLVEKVIQGRDFTAMPETINAVDAWLGSLPGHVYANVRQPPISTLNLAHMIPLSAVWAGPERDEHLAAPPLLFGKTEGSTPFRFSLHVGDVGHTLVVGPTGAGKSVLLALMATQFRRYSNSQVFAFDFGGSIRAAALAMGGDWHDLGGGLTEGSAESVSLQPLAGIHHVPERAWAADWIGAILMREGVAITPVGHHRKLPDQAAASERARDRAADHRGLSQVRAE